MRVLSFWFSGLAAVAWLVLAVLQFMRDERQFAFLAAGAAACFTGAFVLRLVERRRT